MVTYPDGSEPQSHSHNHSGQDSPLHSWHGRAAPMAPVDAESPPAPRFRVDTALDHEVGPNGSQFAEGGNHERGTPSLLPARLQPTPTAMPTRGSQAVNSGPPAPRERPGRHASQRYDARERTVVPFADQATQEKMRSFGTEQLHTRLIRAASGLSEKSHGNYRTWRELFVDLIST